MQVGCCLMQTSPYQLHWWTVTTRLSDKCQSGVIFTPGFLYSARIYTSGMWKPHKSGDGNKANKNVPSYDICVEKQMLLFEYFPSHVQHKLSKHKVNIKETCLNKPNLMWCQRHTSYLSFFSSHTQSLVWFFSTQKCLNRVKTDFATNRVNHDKTKFSTKQHKVYTF